MTPEPLYTDAQFAAQFPAVFRDHGANPQHTCMAWGLEIPPAWRPTVWALCETIHTVTTHLAATHPELEYTVVADQIKEKWGGLRFYWHGETAGWDATTPPPRTPAAEAALREAESTVYGAVLCAERVIAGLCHVCAAPNPLTAAGGYPWHNTCAVCDAALRAADLARIAALDGARGAGGAVPPAVVSELQNLE